MRTAFATYEPQLVSEDDPEPNVEYMVFFYYTRHGIPEDRARELTQRYLEKLSEEVGI